MARKHVQARSTRAVIRFWTRCVFQSTDRLSPLRLSAEALKFPGRHIGATLIVIRELRCQALSQYEFDCSRTVAKPSEHALARPPLRSEWIRPSCPSESERINSTYNIRRRCLP